MRGYEGCESYATKLLHLYKMCLISGARYAMISMKIMLLYLLKRYRFKTKIREEDMRFRFEAVLRLDGGHLVQIEKRQ